VARQLHRLPVHLARLVALERLVVVLDLLEQLARILIQIALDERGGNLADHLLVVDQLAVTDEQLGGLGGHVRAQVEVDGAEDVALLLFDGGRLFHELFVNNHYLNFYSNLQQYYIIDI